MKTRADKLVQQISKARKMGENILEVSGLSTDGVIYAFATANTLVINCKDYETMWQFDSEQLRLQKAIALLYSSIDSILIELCGKPCYQF